MAEKMTTLRGLIQGAVYDLHPKTNVYNVWMDDTTTLAAKLAEVITSLNGKVTNSQLTEAIQQALTEAKASGEFDGKDGATGPQGVGITGVTITRVD